jgi:DivIVA domain-containing protein
VPHDKYKADKGKKPSSAAPEQEHTFELRHYVPADILDISFPASVRGYDRRAVDAYMKRVNRAIAELKVSASPQAAVRHALEQAGQQVHGLLQSARETAEEITASARHESEESMARAKAEAAELVVNASTEADRISAEAGELIAKVKTEAGHTVTNAKAEAEQIVAAARAEAQEILARSHAEAEDRLQRLQEELGKLQEQAEAQMRDIQADTEAVWKERHELLDDIRGAASGLVDLAEAAAARIPRREPTPEEEMPELDTRPMPASGTEAGDGESRRDVTEKTAVGPET